MYSHKRHRSMARAAKGAALLIALAAIGIAAGFWIEQPRFQSSQTVGNDTDAISQSEKSQIGTDAATNLPKQTKTSAPTRWVFGHSLVPGGVRSITELASLIQRDPTLAEHYRDFNLSKGQLVTLDQDSLAFVSYRMDGAIYWQARPTVIRRGEQVLTDGSNAIRVRCGNRIVSFPALPTSPAEPTDMDIVVGKLAEPNEVHELRQPAEVPFTSPETPITLPELPTGLQPAQMEPAPGWFVPVPIVTPLPGPAPSPPSPAFGADEFSNVRLTIFGRSRSLPTGLLTLIAGAALAAVLRLALWRSS